MPNWCENDLTITGSAEDVEKVLAFIQTPASDDKDERIFDFNKVIPYPDNFKELDAKAAEYQEEAANAISGENLRSIREKYGMEPDEVFFKDGYNSGGYEWCKDNWGTKWHACNAREFSFVKAGKEKKAGIAKFTFDTAWSPPLPIVEKLGAMFTSVSFNLEFFEGGVGFQGTLDIYDGESSGTFYDDYDGERGG